MTSSGRETEMRTDSSGDENSADGSEMETSNLSPGSISDNYGATAARDRAAVRQFDAIPLCGFVFYIMAFFGFTCSLMLRESLSEAIVAMVNQTDMDGSNGNVSDGQCPRDPELEQESGEFNWNRMEQGVLLSAYYYGYVITQVRGRNVIMIVICLGKNR